MFVSEERQIVERIKKYIKTKGYLEYYCIMLRDGRIIDIRDYFSIISAGKINPQDAYVYIARGRTNYKANFYYPFLEGYGALLFAYLSKLGFYNWPLVVSATGLKYIADAEVYRDYLSIELVNLDTAVNNLNLRKIVAEVLGEKLISEENKLTNDEYDKIVNALIPQRLFAGYTLDEARRIITDYYDKGNQSLAKEAVHIVMDYYRTFNPYTVCYDTRTWKEVDCLQIELD